jgi:hypothetical protein
LPFGEASLDRHCRTFLGLPKSDALTAQDKQDMRRAFREKTAAAYGYAASDPVHTLLLYEAMTRMDRDVARAFGQVEQAGPMRPTLGARVSAFLEAQVARAASGSTRLTSKARLRELMCRGGLALLTENPAASRYGTQTGQVHGGLLHNRTPARFWHRAPGMFADADLEGCYNAITSRIGVHIGQPVILEPGARRLSLTQAVTLAQGMADDDGWVIRVSGDFASPFGNVLIPSTEGALTPDNWRKRKKKVAQPSHTHGRRKSGKDRPKTRLYSARIECGVVTAATWALIQALPAELRQHYEGLNADSILFYPRALVARDGAEYDRLVQARGYTELPWQQWLDENRLVLHTELKLDADYVTLRFDLADVAQRIGALRREAQQRHGKKSGQDAAWKAQANTLYGVLASPHKSVNNLVAANVITGFARASAFLMGAALNGAQVITDGCTFRLDQVPAVPLAECLKLKPDYLLSRADTGDAIPFLDPATIPTDPGQFTAWYREHVRGFLDCSGEALDNLLQTHELALKPVKDQKVTFDALGCDGAGNYFKCLLDEASQLQVIEHKARGYGEDAKKALQPWLLRTYSTDTLTELTPLTEDRELLALPQARQAARVALNSGEEAVYLPLGFARAKVLNYRAIRLSAFVFCTPAQRAVIERQVGRFEERNGAGLEVLALRRGYGQRHQGSVEDVARSIHELVRSGSKNLTRDLNLRVLSAWTKARILQRQRDLNQRKAAIETEFNERIRAEPNPEDRLAGLVLTRRDQLEAGPEPSTLPLITYPNL